MRLLHFADLHLDTPFCWAPPGVARDRQRGLRETLRRICALADQQRVDALTCGGDLYERDRFTADTAAFLQASFAELDPLPVFLAPGNHDCCDRASLYRQVEWSPNVHVFDEPRLRAVPLAEGMTLWGAGHQVPVNTPGFMEGGFRVTGGGVHVALFHGSDLAKMPRQEEGKIAHAPFRAEQLEMAGLNHALVGHFHSPSDEPRYTYPGNPDPLSFGEDGQRAAVLVELADDGAVTRTRFPVASSLVHDLAVELSDIRHSGEVIDQVHDALRGLTGVARVTLSGEIDPVVDLNANEIATRARNPDLAVMVRVGAVWPAYDLERLAGEPTARGQFVRDVRAAVDLDQDQRRRVLITGLRALDDRDDLEVW